MRYRPGSRLEDPDVQRRVAFSIIAGLVAVASILSLHFLLVSLLTPRLVTPVIQVHPESIQAIDISCEDRKRLPFDKPKTVEITSSASIAAIGHELNSVTQYSPNHPTCGTRCIIGLRMEGRSLSFRAHWNCRDPQDATLIYFYSNGSWGLALGTYRSDHLGRALGRAIVEEGYPRPGQR